MEEKHKITAAQLKKIQTIFSQLGIKGNEKQAMIYSLTSKRTTTTKDITFSEAKYLIEFLNAKISPKSNDNKEIDIIKEIYNMSFQFSFLNKNFKIQKYNTKEDRKMNIAKINMFCRQRGTVKKNITSMNLFELEQTLRQFKAMYNTMIVNK